MRYFLRLPTDWQDEMSIFLLVGATFLTGAYVQAHRGHVGIEALAEILPAGVNRLRLLFVDIASFAFCAFFSWKSWTLLHEAVVDEQTTSSTWATAAMDSLRPDVGRHDAAVLADPVANPGRISAVRRTGDERRHHRHSLRRRHAAGHVFGHADRLRARRRSPSSSWLSSCRRHRSIRSPRTSTRKWPTSPCCRSRCSSSRARRSANRAPAPISIRQFMPGCTGSPAAWASPTSSPARSSRRWPDRARRPARRSAAPASRRCAGAATRRASPPASSPPAARSAFCCRRRSP